jgi:hypothetical protein
MSDASGEHRLDYMYVGDGDGNWEDDDYYPRSPRADAEDVARQQQQQQQQVLRDSPFVPCTKLRDSEWAKPHNSYHLGGCDEFELGPDCELDELFAVAAGAAGNAAPNKASNSARAAVRHLRGISGADTSVTSPHMNVFWLTPYIFLARGHGAEMIDSESEDRLTVILRLDTDPDSSGSAHADADSTIYSIGCRTRLPSDDTDRSGLVAAVDLLVALVAGRSWVRLKLSTRRTLRPLSASTEALQRLVAAPTATAGLAKFGSSTMAYRTSSGDRSWEAFMRARGWP